MNKGSSVPSPKPIPIFDGHNDALLRLHRREDGDAVTAFLDGEDKGHLDLPKARSGGFAGGLFAIFVPSPRRKDGEAPPAKKPQDGSDTPPAPRVDMTEAQRVVFGMASLLMRIERQSQGRVRMCRDAADIEHCLADDVLAAVLHIEGAEAIDEKFEMLDVLYAAGLRSLGPVWSRPNAFGHGVPFRCPSSPDTGPGLTDLGKELIRACNRLRILIDLSHLNERGFWDVAELSDAPLVATHSNAHALCAASRNLTDAQLDAIAASGGVVGVNFAVTFLREDGSLRPDETGLDEIVRHVDYMVERMGIDHVAFGSDFDGAEVPAELGGLAGLPRLVDALRAAG